MHGEKEHYLVIIEIRAENGKGQVLEKDRASQFAAMHSTFLGRDVVLMDQSTTKYAGGFALHLRSSLVQYLLPHHWLQVLCLL